MENIKIRQISELETENHKHNEYEYTRKKFLSWSSDSQCVVSVYEIPPLKSAYPYHSHSCSEEIFYILSGTGSLRTPEGIKTVKTGDLIHFPAGKESTHQLTNCSATETLVYLDIDTKHPLDVTTYPDSNKIGIWGKDINKLYNIDDNKDYYDGE